MHGLLSRFFGCPVAVARSKAGLKARTPEPMRTIDPMQYEKPESRAWLESLAPEEREAARLALRGKVA